MADDFVWAIDGDGKPSKCRAKMENRGKRNCKHKFHNDENLDPNTFFKQCSEQMMNERRDLARDENTPSELLDNLARDENVSVRMAVAENPSISLRAFERLSQDKEAAVRIVLAQNEKIPVHILGKLVDDENLSVREKVAKASMDLLGTDERGQAKDNVKRLLKNTDDVTVFLDVLDHPKYEQYPIGLDAAIAHPHAEVRSKAEYALQNLGYEDIDLWAADNPDLCVLRH